MAKFTHKMQLSFTKSTKHSFLRLYKTRDKNDLPLGASILRETKMHGFLILKSSL